MTTFAAINLKELKHFETFENIAQMDESIYNYIDFIQNDVPKSVIDVLLCLGKASLRCVGLSFMKQGTIAKETGYSRKTINKALKTLEALGVVDSVRTKTKAGRPSVKVVRILPFCLERLQQDVTSYKGDEANNDAELTLVDSFEPFEQESKKHLKEDNKDGEQDIPFEQLDSSFVPKNIVDKDFIKVAKPFFGASRIFKLWGIVKNTMKQRGLEAVTQDVVQSTIEAFKTTVFMYKAKRIKSTFENYFFGVLSSELAAVKRREVREEVGFPFYNWLEA